MKYLLIDAYGTIAIPLELLGQEEILFLSGDYVNHERRYWVDRTKKFEGSLVDGRMILSADPNLPEHPPVPIEVKNPDDDIPF